MESFSSLKKPAVRIVSSDAGEELDLSSLLSGQGEKGIREGGRVRAWREAEECLDKAEAEGMSFSELRALMATVKAGKISNGKIGTVGRQTYIGAVSAKGNRVLVQTGDVESLKEDFSHAFAFSKKSDALVFVDSGEVGNGVQAF